MTRITFIEGCSPRGALTKGCETEGRSGASRTFQSYVMPSKRIVLIVSRNLATAAGWRGLQETGGGTGAASSFRARWGVARLPKRQRHGFYGITKLWVLPNGSWDFHPGFPVWKENFIMMELTAPLERW